MIFSQIFIILGLSRWDEDVVPMFGHTAVGKLGIVCVVSVVVCFFQLRARQTDDMGRELAKSLLPQPSITERQQGFGCDLRDGTDERSIRWQQTGCKYKAAMNKFSVSW